MWFEVMWVAATRNSVFVHFTNTQTNGSFLSKLGVGCVDAGTAAANAKTAVPFLGVARAQVARDLFLHIFNSFFEQTLHYAAHKWPYAFCAGLENEAAFIPQRTLVVYSLHAAVGCSARFPGQVGPLIDPIASA